MISLRLAIATLLSGLFASTAFAQAADRDRRLDTAHRPRLALWPACALGRRAGDRRSQRQGRRPRPQDRDRFPGQSLQSGRGGEERHPDARDEEIRGDLRRPVQFGGAGHHAAGRAGQACPSSSPTPRRPRSRRSRASAATSGPSRSIRPTPACSTRWSAGSTRKARPATSPSWARIPTTAAPARPGFEAALEEAQPEARHGRLLPEGRRRLHRGAHQDQGEKPGMLALYADRCRFPERDPAMVQRWAAAFR